MARRSITKGINYDKYIIQKEKYINIILTGFVQII